MRGWSSFLAGFLLLGVAYWSYTADGFGSSTLMCAAAAAFFFFCGAQGREVSENGDPTAVIDFVKDPAEAIVDSAGDRLADWLGDRKPAEEPARGAGVNHRQALVDWLHDRDEPPAFDPDAVIARYMENRGPEIAAQPESAAPVRSFGRKGL